MTTSNQINFEPLSLFFSELLHALARPAVGLQIALIFTSLLVSTVSVVRLKRGIKVFRFEFNQRANISVFSLLIIGISYAVLAIAKSPSGLIKETGFLLILFLVFSLIFQALVQFTKPSKMFIIKGYRDKLFLPSFVIYTLFVITQTFGDPASLFYTSLVELFGTSFNLLDLILFSIGLLLWVNFSTLTTQTIEWLFGFEKNKSREVSKAIYTLTRYGLIGFGVFVIIGLIGINPTVFGLITGGLSVGVGLGLKEIVSNFASGIWLLLEGSTKPGDVINLNLLDNSSEPFQIAEITDCGLRAVTVINSGDHSERIIPNNLFFTNQITTYTKKHNIIARKSYFGVSYGADPNLVIKLITPAVAAHPDVLASPPPSTVFIQFGDSSLNFYAKFFIKDVASGIRVTGDVNLIIWSVLKENNIEIPFPQRTLHLPDVVQISESDDSLPC